RVLIIGTFSVAGERLFTLADAGQRPASNQYNSPRPVSTNYQTPRPAQSVTSSLPANNYPRPAPKPRPAPTPSYNVNYPEPTYHPIGMTAMGRSEQNSSVRR
ncbi:MAG: hypothetical protein Q7T89_00140, partial [Anaerolineales bacterium]|nr:hypothetical protein [Anaerolineales bacterium]